MLADRLVEQLEDGIKWRNRHDPIDHWDPIKSRIIAELIPKRQLEELILPFAAEQAIRELVEEQRRADVMQSHGLDARNSILLVGPPGNGKTTLAEAIAFELNVPMISVRYEALIDNSLTETTLRLASAFAYVRSRHCLLFFDEFDVVGKERGNTHETGIFKRVVGSLLMQVDALPPYVVIVAASNHPELLDRAVWSRFHIRAKLPMPSSHEIALWFKCFEKRTGYSLGFQEKGLLRLFNGMSFAEIENFGRDALRRIALSQPCSNVDEIVAGRLDQLKESYSTANEGVGRTK